MTSHFNHHISLVHNFLVKTWNKISKFWAVLLRAEQKGPIPAIVCPLFKKCPCNASFTPIATRELKNDLGVIAFVHPVKTMRSWDSCSHLYGVVSEPFVIQRALERERGPKRFVLAWWCMCVCVRCIRGYFRCTTTTTCANGPVIYFIPNKSAVCLNYVVGWGVAGGIYRRGVCARADEYIRVKFISLRLCI